ncbi:DUF177 domain-containing protein [Sphingomonas sp. ASV193]|uniref:YceD family protein n=1 Tax=Sphingomonas sp. ASV193 TaxID=3144405 RepID=UPI0032E8AEC7
MSGWPGRVLLSQIRDGDRIEAEADEAERAAIAERLRLSALHRLEAVATLTRDGEAIHAEGRLRAALAQPCIATGDPVEASVDERFSLRFLPEPKAGADDEIELGDDDLDTVFHDGAAIELGDALADTLALGLDPYPRSAGADAALKAAGVMSEEEAGPFAGLAALKDKLRG